MSWKDQANHSRKKAYNSLNKIKKIRQFLDNDLATVLLNALVLPHINYCQMHGATHLRLTLKNLILFFTTLIIFNLSIKTYVNLSNTTIGPHGLQRNTSTLLSIYFKHIVLVKDQHNHHTRNVTSKNLVITRALK